jgi:hypothetical protein
LVRLAHPCIGGVSASPHYQYSILTFILLADEDDNAAPDSWTENFSKHRIF